MDGCKIGILHYDSNTAQARLTYYIIYQLVMLHL